MDKNKPILFFDGHCNLCDGLVNFVMKYNKGQFYIASIQGKTGKEKLSETEIKTLFTLIFLDQGKKYFKSKAVFRLCWTLGGWLSLLSYLKVIPSSIADFIYDWVAKNRYRWFGKKELCRLATDAEKELFLD